MFRETFTRVSGSFVRNVLLSYVCFVYNARSTGTFVLAPTTTSVYKHLLHRRTSPHICSLLTSSSQHTPTRSQIPSMPLY